FFFSSRRRHTRCLSDWSSDVCSSDLVFFNAEAEVLDGAPDRRHADGYGQRVPQLGQRAIRLLLDQRRQRVEMWLEFAPRPIPLRARGNPAGLTAPLPQQAYPRAADGVLLGDGIRHQAGVQIAERTNPKIHRVGAHGPPEMVAAGVP